MTNPIRPTDNEARVLAQDLLRDARFAALGVITPDGAPMVTRVAFGLDPTRAPISLVSNIAVHTQALRANPACSLMIGEPGPKGDPLTHPRLTLVGKADFIAKGADHDSLAAHYLKTHPKSKLYIGFADFGFIRMTVMTGHLNGGFGKAYSLDPQDLRDMTS